MKISMKNRFLLAVLCAVMAFDGTLSAQSVARPAPRRDVLIGTSIVPYDQIHESEKLARALITPGMPGYRAKGDQHKKYPFADAGKDMPYRVYVPKSWDGKSDLPMVFFLHGGWNTESSYLDQNNQQMLKLAEKYGFLLASPLGYSTGGAYGNRLHLPAEFGKYEACRSVIDSLPAGRERELELSERDVLNVLELVLAEYPVDRSRIFLTGHSMGSGGTWYLAAKYPKFWRALAPMSGPFVDETSYPWDRIRTKPIFMSEGTLAEASLESSRMMSNWMKGQGFQIEYKEVEADHPGMVPLVLPDVFAFFDRIQKQ
jgi:predicted peptidase